MRKVSLAFLICVGYQIKAIASDVITSYLTVRDTTISRTHPTTIYSRDTSIKAGANGSDEYRFLIWFNSAFYARRVEKVYLRLGPMITVAPAKVTPLEIRIINNPGFTQYTTWSNQPSAFSRRQIEIPTITAQNWQWLYIDITGIYRNWQNGVWSNNGLMFVPVNHNNTIDGFTSSEHSLFYAPNLRLIYFDFKFPLKGGYRQSSVSGYHFSDHWEGRYALDRVTKLRHTGTDFAAKAGDTVYACADGRLKEALINNTWGGWVVVEHPNSWQSIERAGLTDGICTTTYLHVIPTPEMLAAIGRGEQPQIYRGGVIGTIASGNQNFGPHLHFQLRNAHYHATLSRIGRLPAISATTPGSPTVPEVAFPECFINPETAINWDYGNF